ncbi:MAG TPA: hypothetical protein VK530_14235, partial [Candidatus Acidoferrum sp.]|nr:hypothetical protein [Candidatus Acidoferrum sp.]
MLAIITVVAVIFLGIARRNRAGVSMQQEQTVAEYAAEAAFQRAKGDVVAQIMSSKQLLGYDLVVSRGYDLWDTNLVPSRPLRDPYGDSNGPVVVNTNYAGASGGPDPRPHLDLNRNGEIETTFLITNRFTNAAGVFTNTVTISGDPEWIFLLDRPERPYGPDNRFVARMAYIAIPAGKALDANTIHNTNSQLPPSAASGNFTRNQGVGAWELNLAAMLHELDTNVWDFTYGPFPSPSSTGAAFTNAADFVLYRSTNTVSRQTLPSFTDIFGARATVFESNGVDDLGDDLLLAGPIFGENSGNKDSLLNGFPGADALRHYFTHQDFFDATKTSLNFVNNLRTTLANPVSSNPRTNGYKFYELLSQLATDTGTENRNRINLNWANLGTNKLAALRSWDTNKETTLLFFTNAAQRILESMQRDFRDWVVTVGTNYYTNSVTNVNHIMIAPANFYVGGVHRIMQQAANILDASRTNEFPSVFRPIFGPNQVNLSDNTNLFIIGWTNDSSHDGLMKWLAENTNGIPAVIGAKRGLPNFNEYTFRTDMLVERKLQLQRPGPGQAPNKTNQMYVMGISNTVAVEAWNSYSTPFPHASVIEVTNTISVVLSNIGGAQPLITHTLGAVVSVPSWNGRTVTPENGFKLPLFTNIVVLSNSVYNFILDRFEALGTNVFNDSSLVPNPPGPFGLPNWFLNISNHLVYIHRVGTNIIDFVVLRDNSSMDLSSNLATRALGPDVAGFGTVWNTNRQFGAVGPTEGIRAQIQFSQTGNTADWIPFSYNNGSNDVFLAQKNFTEWMNRRGTNTNNVVQAPFNPIARFIRTATWQANDPLVHYHVDDLSVFTPIVTEPVKWNEPNITTIGSSSISNINKPYAPWGNEGGKNSSDPNSLNFRLRDSGVSSSDAWNFPTNKFPSVGWLGRVHRGTPWQTIYFKSGAAALAEWRAQANSVAPIWQGVRVLNHPTNDLRMADIFTTALTDSSAQGLLSINQSRLPAWSAAFAGVVVLTNILDDNEVENPFSQVLPIQSRFGSIFIEPTHGDTNSPMWLLWSAIQAERIKHGGVFSDFSQVLAVPELTTESPFLNLSPNQRAHGIDDFAYERIPQQILGLLRIGQPRVVIYAYGQALKPERINSSTRLTENYQITSEFATRTVLRIEGTAEKPRAVVESFNILPPD